MKRYQKQNNLDKIETFSNCEKISEKEETIVILKAEFKHLTKHKKSRIAQVS